MKWRLLFLLIALSTLPTVLFIEEEATLAQILLFTQLSVVWGLLPFYFRSERSVPEILTSRTPLLLLVSFVFIGLPYFAKFSEIKANGELLISSARVFGDLAELLLILAMCLSTTIVMGVLIKRRSVG